MILPKEREGLAVEQFLKGCSDRNQAYLIFMQRPTSLQDTIAKMRLALSNKTLILEKPDGETVGQNVKDKNMSRLR